MAWRDGGEGGDKVFSVELKGVNLNMVIVVIKIFVYFSPAEEFIEGFL